MILNDVTRCSLVLIETLHTNSWAFCGIWIWREKT